MEMTTQFLNSWNGSLFFLLKKPGFRMEFIPMKIGAGMTPLDKTLRLWTDTT